MSKNPQCDVCAKSGLAIALFRPSVVANDARLRPVGAERVRVPEALLDGRVPGTGPTESRPVLRLLRKGYLHLYSDKPLWGSEQWQTYRITDRAELIPLDLADMINTQGEVVCNRTAHNVHGLRTLHIPQAHKAGKLWIAFSANLWSDTIKARNKADASIMQCIDVPAILGGAVPANGFQPTAEALGGHVAECAIPKFQTSSGAS